MAFKEDFEKLKNSWGDISLTWKIILGTMLSMQAMSIASIGKSVYEFKGFIIKGIEFYHTLTEPLLDIVHYLEIPLLNRELLDSITWALLYVGIILRAKKFLRNKSDMYMGLAGLAAGLLGMVVGGGGISGMNSYAMFLAIISMICLYAYLVKSWMPLFYFCLPIIVVSILAAISQGVSRS
jgi:hypothetical protein